MYEPCVSVRRLRNMTAFQATCSKVRVKRLKSGIIISSIINNCNRIDCLCIRCIRLPPGGEDSHMSLTGLLTSCVF